MTTERDDRSAVVPKIELHVHLEGTVRPRSLLEMARRNDVALPGDTVDEIEELYAFRDFAHFIEVWILTTNVLRTFDDFHRVVVEYAAEAKGHGAVYIEGIFSPAERVARGVRWDDIFGGYCEGAAEARDRFGVEVRLTPDIYRGCPVEEAEEVARHAVRYRDRGVVGLGLGGLEAEFPCEPYGRAFEIARDGGLGSVPHAGEAAGADSVRRAVDALRPERIRHGIRAEEDPVLLEELADRGIVFDVCPTSNLRTGAVGSLDDHPLPRLVEAGVPCSISTDDPAMFGTDLTTEYEVAERLGVDPRTAFSAGLAGALCDERTRRRLKRVSGRFDGTPEGRP